MNYDVKIIEFCSDLGLDTVGFTKCRRFDELLSYLSFRKEKGIENEFEEKIIENRINPNIYMNDGKTIISIAFPYIYNLNYKNGIDFSKYTLGKDYHVVINEYLKKVCLFIESIGGKAKGFVDNNFLPERYIAYLCGLGFIGRNNMLITKKYGSFVFLGEIITDLDIVESDDEIKSYANMKNETECACKNCTACLKACPTSAINNKEECNSNICLSYITQKKYIGDEWFEKLDGRIFGCDTCQRACAFNKNIEVGVLPEFRPYDFMEEINMDELLNMSNQQFKEKYLNTSSGWRGKNIIIRNALISNFMLLNNKYKISMIKSPYINDYYHRLLSKFTL